MMEITNEMILNRKTPILGVCVGMQMLAKSSDEGRLPGLGWVNADVRKFDFPESLESRRLPHMGWNDVTSQKENPLLLNLEKNARFYFLHSYYFNCMDSEDSVATSHYGFDFTSIINHQNIYGVQFHPEKSHHFGVQLLKNFAEI
jgi:glutamine amidotransferase